MSKHSYSRFKISWVLINELAIGTAPKTSKDLLKLRDEGIENILSLCTSQEADSPETVEEMFRFYRFPLYDHKSNILPTIEQINQSIDLLSKLINLGTVYIHCLAGMERSPLICLGYLIREKGLTLQQALDYMMQVHPLTNPLPEQLSLLNKL